MVATSLWETPGWLPRNHLPKHLANLLTRTKPSSLVVLSESRSEGLEMDLPDQLLIPAEECQVVVEGAEVCFQATLDFELTMQAPAVVKAVKRLKRARKKFLDAYPGLGLSGDHIALIPVGWAQSDRRYLEKTADFQRDHLAFCGDSYGPSILGDENILSSLAAAREQFAKHT